ncbi:hypothetical protein [Roseibium sp.]|uniref:hypothetical protein n=1 Tax=Roseibium sp. TaxID=1936156 RepID=UPI00391D4189
MAVHTPRAFSYEPETFRAIAQHLQTYRTTGDPDREKSFTAPLIVDWSKTLLPFPGIIGTSQTATILEPVFAFSEDNSWALLANGWVRLKNHVDEQFNAVHRKTP